MGGEKGAEAVGAEDRRRSAAEVDRVGARVRGAAQREFAREKPDEVPEAVRAGSRLGSERAVAALRDAEGDVDVEVFHGPGIRVRAEAYFESSFAPERRTATKASCGTFTVPNCFIRFLPSFCLLRSFCLRVMSPP